MGLFAEKLIFYCLNPKVVLFIFRRDKCRDEKNITNFAVNVDNFVLKVYHTPTDLIDL